MTVYVVMTSYVPDLLSARWVYGLQTMKSLADMLKCDDELQFILANDGPVDQPHVERICNIPRNYGWKVQATGGEHKGVGGSLNRALKLVPADALWMYCTDDWMLTAEYNITQAVKLIDEQQYHYVRLGPPHPNIECHTRFSVGLGWWLELDPRPGGFAFGTRPFVASKKFYDIVGSFREECDAYEAERNYADRVRNCSGMLALAEIVSGSLEGPFEHLGAEEVGDRWP